MSSRSRIVVPTLALCATVGTFALMMAAVFATGVFPAAHADAAPIQSPSDVLGVGRFVIPAVVAHDMSDKVPQAGDGEMLEELTTVPARTQAPLPKPKPKPAAAPRAAATAAPSRAGEGGWQSARASWYGPGFYGRKTASGAVLTKNMMNVAHKSLAFGTQVQFEYKGRTVTAVVNDRGPFVGGRVWDLGPGTAKALGFSGVGTVKYRILGR